jgi:hypothetical protein
MRRHHLDRHAAAIHAHLADGDPDEDLTPKTVANILHVSLDALQSWRVKDCGPYWARRGPRAIRYPRGKLLDWLRGRARVHQRRA